MLRRPVETALRTAVAMVNQPHALVGTALVNRLFQGIEDEPCMRRGADPPTDNAAGIVSWRSRVVPAGQDVAPLPGQDVALRAEPLRG